METNIQELPARAKNLSGKVFGNWTVLNHFEKRGLYDRIHWLCKCSCGTEKLVSRQTLLEGTTKSCGCIRIEAQRIRQTTHGATTHATVSKEYRAWIGMKTRCYNTKTKRYKHYGGKGVLVCDRWLNSFENFIEDMGYAPSKKHSLDRKENDKGYSKENCRWGTILEQANNTTRCHSIEFNGKMQNLKQWCDELSLDYYRTLHRLRLGWSVNASFTCDKNPGKYRREVL